MKISILTEDGKTISMHFGRALYYRVFTIEDGKVAQKGLRDKLA